MAMPEPPLDRAAARRRIQVRRQRAAAAALSGELRTAAYGCGNDELLGNLLLAVADEMDAYLGCAGCGQATGGDQDPPVWRAALTIARTINTERQAS